MGLSLQNIDKIVSREIHLKDVSLDFESGSRNVLLGRTLAGSSLGHDYHSGAYQATI